MTTKIRLFHKFIASLWLVSVMLLGFGMNPAMVAGLKVIDGDLGLLHRPVSQISKWSQKHFMDTMFRPVETKAAGAVVVVANPPAVAAAVALTLEQKLLRAVLMAIVRFIINKINEFINKLISSLTKAQDQFGIMKSLEGYARKALAIGTARLYECAVSSVDSIVAGIGGSFSSAQNNKSGCDSTGNPTAAAGTFDGNTTNLSITQAVTTALNQGRQCVALNAAVSTPTQGCTKKDTDDRMSLVNEAIKKDSADNCKNSDAAIGDDAIQLINNMVPSFALCVGRANQANAELGNNINRENTQLSQRVKEDLAKAETKSAGGALTIADSKTINDIKEKGKISPVIVSEAPISVDSCFSANSNCKFSIDGKGSDSNLNVISLRDPKFGPEKALEVGNLATQAKPQPGGQADESEIGIQAIFQQIMDQVFQAIQNLLLSVVNGLLNKLDSLSGGNGFFSGLINDISGSLKGYLGEKVQGLTKDLNSQYKDLKANIFGGKTKTT
jgi:hypothetical protein